MVKATSFVGEDAGTRVQQALGKHHHDTLNVRQKVSESVFLGNA